MARDTRTRLNAELAHQYSGARKKGTVTPGRNALTGELEEKQDVAPDGVEVEQEELEGEQDQEVEVEAKKSLFELPRKEPSRQPLPASPFGAQPAAPAAAAPPSSPPKAPRRG